MPNTQPNCYLTVQDVSEQLGVAKAAVLSWLGRGELVGIDVCRERGKKRRWRISAAELQRFLQSRQPAPKPPVQRQRRKQAGVVEYF
jgi:excisionase family DNA binding protein